MNRIERAERRYRDIVTDELVSMAPETRYRRMPVAKILAWIDNYVLPAIEEVYQRPLFRDHATWPQRVLARGADTSEHAAVERVDRALVTEAQALRRLMRNRLVARMLDEMTEQRLAGETTTEDGIEWVQGLPNRRHMIPSYVADVDRMSRRPWTDLVCVDDYFVPVGGMMRKTPLPRGVTEGAFVVSLTPHLFAVGDCITRSMMQRIRCWIEFLAEARSVVYNALRSTGRAYSGQAEAEQRAHRELGQSYMALQQTCLTGPNASLREACITCVQVYAAFHPAPDLEWLGITDRALQPFTGMLRHNIESTRELETMEQIAGALGDLKHMYRDLDAERPVVEAAISTGGLVLIDAERAVYWEGGKIDQDWRRYRKAWLFLWKLAANARVALSVADVDLYGRYAPPSTMHNRWSRLKELLPPSLRRQVVPGSGERATYRLTIPINRLYLFDSPGMRT